VGKSSRRRRTVIVGTQKRQMGGEFFICRLMKKKSNFSAWPMQKRLKYVE
jgi:hypothetical protein